MVGSNQTRSRRVVSLLVAVSLLSGLMVLTAGSALAKPSGGNNSASAKQCKNWQSLYKEDGSGFVDKSDCTSYAAKGGTILTSPPQLPNVVIVLGFTAASGTYEASGATFGPSPTPGGVSGGLHRPAIDVSTGLSQGCSFTSYLGFQAGGIALVDVGGCDYPTKVREAQNAGAVAVIVMNDVAGDPVTMEGTEPSAIIPAVMVSYEDGILLKYVVIPGSAVTVAAAP